MSWGTCKARLDTQAHEAVASGLLLGDVANCVVHEEGCAKAQEQVGCGSGWGGAECAGHATVAVVSTLLGIVTKKIPKLKFGNKGDSDSPKTPSLEACVTPGPNSFSATTAVLMADGTAKAMEDIQVGDEVLATDPETGEEGPRKVEKVWVHNDDLYILTIDGQRLTTTEDHPFWNESDQEWQKAESLGAGELTRTVKGTARVDGFDYSEHTFAPAYNLTVADIHTYYVLAGKTPVLVHNQGDTPKPGQAYLWRAVTGAEYVDISKNRAWNSPQGVKYFSFSERGADSGSRSIFLYEFGEYLGGLLPIVDLTGSVIDFGSHHCQVFRI
ncbi:intein C-terminal splicing region/intein N-terminal splicing region [Actinoplanes derwentensis]|uniref:Intein C-terminal splicing region/intein N-terminal splicing region n=1 Tax=Actinoplanes derwentensis TaxID=113562 RepID=A0A1H2D6M8_9ACTN|nr:intein C-terminal splicing region/intein N-terminal splicing region [Actinoplanes derwentensis]